MFQIVSIANIDLTINMHVNVSPNFIISILQKSKITTILF